MRRPKPGDVIEIPLSAGRKAYAQYLHYSKMGPILQVFDLIAGHSVHPDQVVEAHPLFPPIIAGLFAAVKGGEWRVIGHRTITKFTHPKFVSTLYDQTTGEARTWFLWDGERDVMLGKTLGPEHKQLEFLVVWSALDVVRRIETGEVPFPYGDLIRDNRFTPRD